MLELAFSILYDPDEALNFVAPNKYEVGIKKYHQILHIVLLQFKQVHHIYISHGLIRLKCSLYFEQYCIWTDGLSALLGKELGSDLTRSDLDTLMSMEMKLRLLDLENISIPEAPPPVPKEPSTYNFTYNYG